MRNPFQIIFSVLCCFVGPSFKKSCRHQLSKSFTRRILLRYDDINMKRNIDFLHLKKSQSKIALDRNILGCLGIFIESTVAAVGVKLFQSYSDRRFRVNEILYGNILSTIYTLYLTSEINVNLLTILLFNAPINKLFSAIMQQFVIFVISITHNATKYCSNIASRSERYTIIVG